MTTTIKDWRDKADKYLTDVISDAILRKNIDISVYNWSVEEGAKGKWLHLSSNRLGRVLHFYRQKMRSILFNLKNNNDLLIGVSTHTIDFKTLPYMSPETMNPVLWAPIVETVAKNKMKRFTNEERLFYAGMYLCEKCGGEDHTIYIDMPTRREDENQNKRYVFCMICDR